MLTRCRHAVSDCSAPRSLRSSASPTMLTRCRHAVSDSRLRARSAPRLRLRCSLAVASRPRGRTRAAPGIRPRPGSAPSARPPCRTWIPGCRRRRRTPSCRHRPGRLGATLQQRRLGLVPGEAGEPTGDDDRQPGQGLLRPVGRARPAIRTPAAVHRSTIRRCQSMSNHSMTARRSSGPLPRAAASSSSEASRIAVERSELLGQRAGRGRARRAGSTARPAPARAAAPCCLSRLVEQLARRWPTARRPWW